MNDFVELVEGFEKRLFKLLKDLLVNPGTVLQSLITGEPEYIKPYQFFNYVSSLIVLIALLLNWFDIVGFWTKEFFLPNYWDKYYQSANEISLTIFPVIGFFFIIAIASCLSFVLFRKPKLSIKHHFFFTLYQFGTILIYFMVFLAIFITVYSVVDITNDVIETFFEGLVYLLLFVIPSLIIIRIQWSFMGIKWLKPIKSIILILLTSNIFLSFYYDYNDDLELILNNEIFYKQAKEAPMNPVRVPDIRKIYYEKSEAQYPFPANTHSESEKFILGFWDSKKSRINVVSLSDTLTMINHINEPDMHDIALYYLNEQPYAITHNHLDESNVNRLWAISKEKTNLISEDSIRFNTLSSMIVKNDTVLVSGISEGREPALYTVQSDSIQLYMQFGDSTSNIVFMLQPAASTLFTITSTFDNNILRAISVNKIDLDKKEIEKSTQLLDNQVADIQPIHEFDWYEAVRNITNPWMGMDEDSSTLYIAFQLMTEETFELQIYKLDLDLNVIKKEYYRPEGNLSYFYAYAMDQNCLYVFGRRFLLVPSSLFGSELSYPFIQRISMDDLQLEDTMYFEKLVDLDGGNLFNGIEYQLYGYDAKLRVDEDSIYLLWMSSERIEQIRLKKTNHIRINGSGNN